MRLLRRMMVVIFVVARVPAGDKPDVAKVAAEDTLRLYHMPEIVVTAARISQDPMDVGRSVTVLRGDELRNALSLSVGEALSLQSGIYVVGAGQTPGALQNIFMRGTGSHQTALFVDDIRIADPTGVNAAVNLSELSTGEIDRIEIVRGAQSSPYGSAAIGGVVNLITRRREDPGFSVSTEARFGTFGRGTSLLTPGLDLSYRDRTGVYFTGHAQYENIRGLDATIDTVSTPGIFQNRDRDDSQSLHLSSRIGFRSEEIDLHVAYRTFLHELDVDKGAYRDDDNYTVENGRRSFGYGGTWLINQEWSIKALGGFSTMHRIAVDDSSVVDRFGNTDRTYASGEWRGATSTHEVQTSVRYAGSAGLLGVGIYRESMTSKSHFYSKSDFGEITYDTDLFDLNLSTSTSSVYGHIELQGATIRTELYRLSLGLGARLSRHSGYGANVTYGVSPAIRVSSDLLVYASHSTGFNAPTLYQLYAPDRDFASGIQRGNAHLKPEHSSSYEIGFKYRSRKFLRVSVALFRNAVRNPIEYVYLWERSIPIGQLGTDWMRNDFRGDTYLNIGTNAARGIECEWEMDVTSSLAIGGNITVLEGYASYASSEIDAEYTQGHHVQLYNSGAFLDRRVESWDLVRRPSTGRLTLDYRPNESLSFNLAIRRVAERTDVFYDLTRGPYGALGSLPVEGYTLVDFGARATISKGLSLTGRIENVFNLRYAEIRGFTTRGRGLYLFLRYSLDQPFEI
ncbi:MAG: TonB-dependent receptor [Ignavibacteria bacterium]|nr:TonB-dependent receptor [Ignavibacteria bacterium]